MSDFDFQPYRDFILFDGDKQQALYTPTDALLPLQVGMIAQQEQGEQIESSPEKKVKQLPVLEGLRKYALGDRREHVILAGRPGSGKSTALQQLRLALAAEGLVPVLVQLKGNTGIFEAIANELEKGDLELELRDIKRLLRNQKLILLLDGINEMPTDELRRDLLAFRGRYLMVLMIFTTRDLAVGGDLGIKRRLEMKPLTELQMQTFVGKRLPVDGEKLLGQLGDRLREIAETPLLLKMLCDVFGQTGQIPENKGELFRLFDREYDKFKVLPPSSEDFRRFKSEILQHLAFVMMTGDSSKPTEFWLTIDKGVAEREIEKFLIDRVSDPAARAKEWIESLKNHYLLQEITDSMQVEFPHQLFQEYYAAEKLLKIFQAGHPDVINEQRFKHFYLNYLKWTEPLKFILGLFNDSIQVVQIVRMGLEVDWFLGANLARETKPNFQNQSIELIHQLIEEKKLTKWLEIVLLEKKRSPFDNENLFDRLESTGLFLTIQDQAIFSEKTTIDELLAALENTCICKKCVDLRRSIIDKLGEMRDAKVIPKVLSFLSNADKGVRVSAIEVTGILGDKNNIPNLLPLLKDPDPYIRFTALVAIWELDIEPVYLSELNQMISALEYNEAARLIFAIHDKYKFYNYEISCVLPIPHQSPHLTTTINAREVKIIENVQNYHESSQNST
jgi:energy-coupling factor transporter ATP-binding protein EcfA2